MEKLLGLDGSREVCLACVTVGQVEKGNVSAPASEKIWEGVDFLPEKLQEASRVSDREIFYEEIMDCYRAGLSIPEFQNSESDLMNKLGVAFQQWEDLEDLEISDVEKVLYPQSVFYRRSKRNYVGQALSYEKFMKLLNLVADAAHQDFPSESTYPSSLSIGMLTGKIEDTPSGFYILDTAKKKLGCVYAGNLTQKMATVCLDQEWLRSAAVHFLLMTNLAEIDRIWGPRGYRYAMLTAGRIGQSIYLGATALGLGCCGIGALYDQEAKDLLGINQASALLYLVAAGPVKDNR